MYLTEYLRSRRVWFKSLPHAPASSAERLAARLHVSGRAVAKAVLMRVGGEDWLAVLPATSRIDVARLAAALHRDPSEVRLATAEEVARRFPNCEPGAIPPFGRLYGIATIVDPSLIQPEIAFAAHTRHEGLRMRFADYEAVETPLRAEFAAPISPAPAPSPSPHRRAG
ncbi:aminoacyl-tRNA deacylase [Paludisphaera mucosa]|uniref:YbaK/EbsC family protein n=1 Tax=Paludisphaera mucosa TaxID=3030827 RepID=A0ABT6FKU9_9BACT|nr:YbaK/EbsC family protein [Paludisphaera mucosa]MDG3008020.1 YbaK/EbsC family protein [Paludisphaera mucosa]